MLLSSVSQSGLTLTLVWLTITSHIETRKLLEVGVLKPFMVFVHTAHYSRPRSLEDL